MKKDVMIMAGILVLAAAVRADFSWGQQIGFDPGQSLDPRAALNEAGASQAPAIAPSQVQAGAVTGNDVRGGQDAPQPVTDKKNSLGEPILRDRISAQELIDPMNLLAGSQKIGGCSFKFQSFGSSPNLVVAFITVSGMRELQVAVQQGQISTTDAVNGAGAVVQFQRAAFVGNGAAGREQSFEVIYRSLNGSLSSLFETYFDIYRIRVTDNANVVNCVMDRPFNPVNIINPTPMYPSSAK